MAAIEALKALKQPCRVELHTDSNYVRDGITNWIHGWRRNGWRTADKKPVKNAELWQELLDAAAPHRIEWHWVKGHAGHPENDRADALACAEADKRADRLAPTSADRAAKARRDRYPRPVRRQRLLQHQRRAQQQRRRRARSGSQCRPARRTRRNRGASGSKPKLGRRSGAKVRRPAHLRSTASTGQSTTLFESVDRGGDVDFLGRGIARVDRDLVERADPDAVVALALEIEAFVRVGDERQVLEAASPDAQLDHGSPLRGEAQAAQRRTLAATWSPQAPAALTRIGPLESSRRPARSRQPSAVPLARGHQARARSRRRRPPARIARKTGGVEGGDLDVGAARLDQAPVHCSRRPGISRSSSARSSRSARSTPSGKLGPVPPSDKWSAPRRTQKRRSRSGQRSSNIGLDASARAPLGPARLSCQKAAERPVA